MSFIFTSSTLIDICGLCCVFGICRLFYRACLYLNTKSLLIDMLLWIESDWAAEPNLLKDSFSNLKKLIGTVQIQEPTKLLTSEEIEVVCTAWCQTWPTAWYNHSLERGVNKIRRESGLKVRIQNLRKVTPPATICDSDSEEGRDLTIMFVFVAPGIISPADTMPVEVPRWSERNNPLLTCAQLNHQQSSWRHCGDE